MSRCFYRNVSMPSVLPTSLKILSPHYSIWSENYCLVSCVFHWQIRCTLKHDWSVIFFKAACAVQALWTKAADATGLSKWYKWPPLVDPAGRTVPNGTRTPVAGAARSELSSGLGRSDHHPIRDWLLFPETDNSAELAAHFGVRSNRPIWSWLWSHAPHLKLIAPYIIPQSRCTDMRVICLLHFNSTLWQRYKIAGGCLILMIKNYF